jgi:hypothetical protein
LSYQISSDDNKKGEANFFINIHSSGFDIFLSAI